MQPTITMKITTRKAKNHPSSKRMTSLTTWNNSTSKRNYILSLLRRVWNKIKLRFTRERSIASLSKFQTLVKWAIRMLSKLRTIKFRFTLRRRLPNWKGRSNKLVMAKIYSLRIDRHKICVSFNEHYSVWNTKYRKIMRK